MNLACFFQKRRYYLLVFAFMGGWVLCGGCAKTSIEEVFHFGDSAKVETPAIPVWTEDYAKALTQAEAAGKLVVADFTGSDWCRWCVRLEKEVFDTPEFIEWSSKNAVLLKVDFPRKSGQATQIKVQNKKLAKKYSASIKGYPTILVLDSKGKVVARTGYVKGGPQAWLRELESQLMRQSLTDLGSD